MAIAMRPATEIDAGPIHLLRRSLEDWLASRRIDQWIPGEVALETIAQQIAGGEWHVLDSDADVVAAVRYLHADPAIWPDDGIAVYVHGLMVHRSLAGGGFGAQILNWVDERARSYGRSLVRLDCVETNEALRHYYVNQGFAAVGRRDVTGSWSSVTLLEKILAERRH